MKKRVRRHKETPNSVKKTTRSCKTFCSRPIIAKLVGAMFSTIHVNMVDSVRLQLGCCITSMQQDDAKVGPPRCFIHGVNRMSSSLIDGIAAALFAAALLHSLAAKPLAGLSRRYPAHSGLFHLLGEVEVVFGFWAMVLIAVLALSKGSDAALAYAESRQYTEPLFVFVTMVIAASKPIVYAVTALVESLARCIPVQKSLATAWLGLAAVPLLGSLITEPAAMTIAAITLAPQLFRKDIPERLKYLAMGVLFVNVSIGGTLTSFAAPPVLMVAATWGWDSGFMLMKFGWKAALAVTLNATIAVIALRRYVTPTHEKLAARSDKQIPKALILIHLCFLMGVVFFAHRPVAFLGLFLMFLGVVQAYARFQNPLILKEALFVAFFLAGLVVLGGMQQWWLQPLLSGVSPKALFFSAVGLTAIADNAALTYLGSLMTGMSDEAKYHLVAGAVAGGGLSIIANAPNPAGVALLREGFRDHSVRVGPLFLGALLPTAIAMAGFLFL